MGQTLTHGIYLPDEGERNCYNGLAGNWTILDGAVGTVAEHTSQIAGKAPAVHTHTKADITDFPVYGTTAGTICEGNDSRLSDARTPVAHTHGKADVTDLFNSANTWSAANTFTGNPRPIRLRGSNNDIYNVQPQSAIYSEIDFVDKNDETMSYILFQHRTDTTETHRLCLRQKRITLDAYYSVNLNNLGNFYPEQNNVINLGTAANQWNNLYAKNYYYNGVAWGLDKANEWTGANTFSGATNSIIFLKFGTSGAYNDIRYYDNNNLNYATIRCQTNFLSLGVKHSSAASGWYTGSSLNVLNDGSVTIKSYDGTDAQNTYFTNNAVYPSVSSVTDLGTSTNKWKTLNGVNPGALGLLDYTQYEPINFSQWNTSGALINTYTPTEDGWLFVNIKDTATNSIFIYAKSIQDAQSYSVSVYGNGSQGYAGRLSTIIPVIKGITYAVIIKAASVNDIYAVTFFPALGNV